MAKSLKKSRIVSLTAFKWEPLAVEIDGEAHELLPHDLDTAERFGELEARMNAAEGVEQLKALRALLEFVCPSAKEKIGKLSPRQQRALIEAWASDGKLKAESDQKDATEVLEHPTSPG